MTWREVERPAAANDRALVDFDGKIDGEPFQGGHGEDVTIVDRLGASPRRLRQGVARRRGGRYEDDFGLFSRRTIQPRTLPARRRSSKFAKRVQEQLLPELDDAFAASFGVSTGKIDGLAHRSTSEHGEGAGRTPEERDQDAGFRRADQSKRACRAALSWSTKRFKACKPMRCGRWASTIRAKAPGRERFQSLGGASGDRRVADSGAHQGA